jgi:hypothetical protein
MPLSRDTEIVGSNPAHAEIWERAGDHARRAADAVNDLHSFIDQENVLSACRQVFHAMHQLQEEAITLVELGIKQGKTQNEIADALHVPASTLRGARKEFS